MFVKTWLCLFAAFVAYSVCVYLYRDPAAVKDKPNAIVLAGWNTWQQKNCQSCHQLYGLGGYMGPDLTNVVRTRSNLYPFIKYGTGKMPNFHLTDKEVSEVIAFLSWVDKTGEAAVPPEAVHWSGTYILNNQQ
jgi:nitric oxide reductase subunit C